MHPFVIDRVNPDILAISEAPLVSAVDIDINKFIPNDREIEVYKDSLKILLGRIMARICSWISVDVSGSAWAYSSLLSGGNGKAFHYTFPAAVLKQ